MRTRINISSPFVFAKKSACIVERNSTLYLWRYLGIGIRNNGKNVQRMSWIVLTEDRYRLAGIADEYNVPNEGFQGFVS